MATDLFGKTPGVYVQEISTLPPSVAEVSTAIPAFIGYTEKRPENNNGIQIVRVSTLLEYESMFGKAKLETFKATVGADGNINITRDKEMVDVDGDGDIDTDDENASPAHKFIMHYSISLYFNNGGGPCYIVSLGTHEGDLEKGKFADGLVRLEELDEPTLIVLTDAVNLVDSADYYELCQNALAQCGKLGDRFAIMDVKNNPNNSVTPFRNGTGTNNLKYGAAYHPYLQTSLTYRYEDNGVAVTSSGTTAQLDTIKTSNTDLYNRVKAQLVQQRVILPPSAAIAGIYAQVDRDRGVWKAPANVSLSSVIGPITKITNEGQSGLNVDTTSGKSINAIRAFTGKGTLVWGARTLAGNDNEWRYVSVRRLFNMIEESSQKSTAFAVFEPNDATTWLKVKGMIESFLYGLWERGALAGPTPESAYFVNVGLGRTMTPQDILEGKMIVEVGVAAVRPAEFIMIRFSHLLQEA